MKAELVLTNGVYAAYDMAWAMEIEWSHGNRIYEILSSRAVDKVAVAGARPTKDPVIIFTRFNVVNQHAIPSECCKYIHRMFYVPYSCADMRHIYQNEHFRATLKTKSSVFKVSASPKSLERAVVELLLSDDHDCVPNDMTLSLDMIHPVNFTHVIHCIYSREEAVFRWGIVTREETESMSLTSDALTATVVLAKSHLPFLPVCRAYYKMQEILDFHFVRAGWTLPDKPNLVAVDVGASPGGWTQYLSGLCATVLSIDPGNLHPMVLALPNVTHVPHLAESDAARQALDALTGFNSATGRCCRPVSLCVCDVNFEAPLAASMLVKSIWPYMASPDYLQSEEYFKFGGGESQCSVYIILTLKLRRSPSPAAIARNYASACAAFSAAFHTCHLDFHLVHLNSNSMNERTLLCRVMP